MALTKTKVHALTIAASFAVHALVGTGVACVTKCYGTGGDCSNGRVEIGPDGRITIAFVVPT